MQIIWLVIPCYNEAEVLPETAKRLADIMEELIRQKKIDGKSKIVFVNDGSVDGTRECMERLYGQNPLFAGINLSRNTGQQNALLAGLLTAKDYADAAISLDCDLQDDITVIPEFIDKFLAGADIVYGVRAERKKDRMFKRASAHLFYRMMHVMGAETVKDHADYRLMSKRALFALSEYEEVNVFLRGIVPDIGFATDVVYYERKERYAGKSKYPLRKMLSFAAEGITSFSVRPVRVIAVLGFFIFLVSIILLIYFFILWLVGHTVRGWATIVLSVWGIGGLELLAIGILGEYIGKIYLETKHRPRYHIESILLKEEKENPKE